MIRLYGAKMVRLVEIGSVTAPPVALTRASVPGVASARGMEPEKPACHDYKAGICGRDQKTIVHTSSCLAISLARMAPTTRPKPQLIQQAIREKMLQR